jgi:hypothetical protein
MQSSPLYGYRGLMPAEVEPAWHTTQWSNASPTIPKGRSMRAGSLDDLPVRLAGGK